MNDDRNCNLETSSSSDSSALAEGKPTIIFDACVSGVATANNIKEIFPNTEIKTLESLGINPESDDSKVCEFIKAKMTASTQVIFITKNDRRSDDQFWSLPDKNIAVIRFTNGGTTTGNYIFSLFALTKTRTYKSLADYFGKDIRLGLQNVYHLIGSARSKQLDLKFPHSHSIEYKHFVGI